MLVLSFQNLVCVLHLHHFLVRTSCGSAAQCSRMATATILNSIALGNREPSGAVTGDVVQEDSSGWLWR